MTRCKYAGPDEPRIVSGRHDADCPGDECRGCLECTEPHCRVCRTAHAAGTCAECVDETRTALHDIARMCDSLPEEVEHRGVDSEAAMLWGPTSDPEARQHVEAAYIAGRLPEGWIEAAHGRGCPLLVNDACTGCAGGEVHPLTVLGTWDMCWRDALEHDEPTGRLVLSVAVDYLDRQLTYMADFPHVPFEDFARDLRRCRAHLEAVLHDQAYGDIAGVGCFDCGGDLERKLTKAGLDDHWTCRRCRRRYTDPEYNLAVRASIERQAEEMTA